jgi:hypothetical protein
LKPLLDEVMPDMRGFLPSTTKQQLKPVKPQHPSNQDVCMSSVRLQGPGAAA